MDGCELIQFIVDNSEMDWNDVCDMERELGIYGEYSGRIAYINYMSDSDIEKYLETENEKFYQRMISYFYETYELDKTKSITMLFTD
jgi:uncharacterized membrane-anchored protein